MALSILLVVVVYELHSTMIPFGLHGVVAFDISLTAPGLRSIVKLNKF